MSSYESGMVLVLRCFCPSRRVRDGRLLKAFVNQIVKDQIRPGHSTLMRLPDLARQYWTVVVDWALSLAPLRRAWRLPLTRSHVPAVLTRRESCTIQPPFGFRSQGRNWAAVMGIS